MPPEAGQGAPAAGGQGSPGAGGAGAGQGAGAGSGAGAGAGSNGGGQQSPAEWYGGFQSNELKEYTKNKGWKDSSEAIESYRHLEKSVGVPPERLLKLPEKADDPAWADINFKLGVPKDAKEYQFEVPKDIGDENFANTAKDWFHKNGVPKAKAEAIVKSWNEYVGQQTAQQQQAQQAELTKQTEGLKKEWGAAFEQNVEAGKRAAKAFGFDTATINKLESAMGFAGVMKFMANLQSKIGEDSFVGSNQNNSSFGGVMTPAQAKAQIELRKKDADFSSRLLKKDSAVVTEWTNLHKMAYPDQY